MKSDFEITEGVLDRAIIAYESISDSRHGVYRVPMSAALESAIYDSSLVQEVLKLREALEFYADPNAWNQPPVKTRQGMFTTEYENESSKCKPIVASVLVKLLRRVCYDRVS